MQQQIFITPIRRIILHVMILLFTSASPFFAQSQKFTQSTTQSILDLDDGEMRESCPANVCFHGGMCFTKTMPDGTKEFECECLEGFTGDLCELKCNLPCQNGGQCIQMGTNASFCICPTGFTGTYCEKVDSELAIPSEETLKPIEEECSVKGRKCLNGGRCIHEPENSETFCKCKGQFTGIWCDRPLRLTIGNSNKSEDNDEQQLATVSSSHNDSNTKAEETTSTISPREEETTSSMALPLEAMKQLLPRTKKQFPLKTKKRHLQFLPRTKKRHPKLPQKRKKKHPQFLAMMKKQHPP